MDAVVNWISQPLGQLIGGVGVILILALLLRHKRRRNATQSTGKPLDPRIKRYVTAGNFEAAARIAQQNGDLESAQELYLRAQKPARAAQLAQRLDRPQQAAELYERAKDLRRAATLYRQAGMAQKADDLLSELDTVKPDAEGAPPPEGIALATNKILGPRDRARQSERAFETARAKALGGDSVAQGQVQELGRTAAEALLSLGETQRAAEICRDADLIDQAINLYVNLLGDPGAAAALLAKRGDHKRAAELYEAAGQKERALTAWINWSEGAPDPLSHLNALDRLGQDAVIRMLDTLVERRPPSKETLELSYRIAEAYEERERADSAIPLLEKLSTVDPGYRDVAQRLVRLRQVITDVRQDPAPGPPGEPNLPEAGTLVGLSKSEPEDDGVDVDLDISESSDVALEKLLDSPAIERLVGEVAAAAAQHATALAQARKPSGLMPPVNVIVTQDASIVKAEKTRTQRAAGIEPVSLALHFVADSAVEAAREGPPAAELEAMLAGHSAGLQNIEILYRLGLAHAAAGKWAEARNAFLEVEKVSPGYRDAAGRANEFTRWQAAVDSTVGSWDTEETDGAPRYDLQGEIGRGGMAVVYRAHDTVLDREVALKFLTEEISGQTRMLQLFQREARAAAKLNHPNIVTIFDVGVLAGRAFICMEFVEGRTVEQLIRHHKRLKVLDALRIIADILAALEYAEAKQIVHRDIKPSNMMRNELGVVKLMDFGLAKSFSDKGESKTTMIAGTPTYMAPEQFTGKNLNIATDLFAVGASLFEMLTGETPFDGMSRDKAPPPVSEINPTVPRLVDEVLARALEFDRERRFKRVKDMRKPIQQILGAVSSFMNQQEPLPSSATRHGVGAPSSEERTVQSTASDSNPHQTKATMASKPGKPAKTSKPGKPAKTSKPGKPAKTSKPGRAQAPPKGSLAAGKGPTGTVLRGLGNNDRGRR